jgi:ectoine hydroxylase-related dioxygenase (phytanoyl-CoA dioxygenase family)
MYTNGMIGVSAHQTGLLSDIYSDSALSRDGFVVLHGMLKQEEIAILSESFRQHAHMPVSGLYTSHNRSPIEENLRVSAAIKGTIVPTLRPQLSEADIVFAHWINKSESQGDEMPLHQDWSITFEDRFSIAHLWCPLVDVGEENGCMYVVPGSHRFFGNYRSGSLGIPYFNRTADTDSITRSIPMKSGDVLVYHPALFHGSYCNRSGKPRPVALALLTQKQAPMRVFHHSSDGIEVYPVDAEKILAELPALERGSPPAGVSPVRKIQDNRVPNGKIDAQRLLEHHRARQRGRIFLNNTLEQAFLERGYVTVPLLSKGEVEELNAFFQKITPSDSQLFTTFASSDTDYCLEVDSFTKKFLAPHFDRLFEKHRPFWGNFFLKSPGAEAMQLHADLQYVDEPDYISVNMWIPLCDTDPRNGALGVVPCSHLYLRSLRGTNMTASYRKLALEIQQRHGRTISLNAGTAIIYDHRLLHFSTANITASERLAIAMVGVPEEVRAIHFYADSLDAVRVEKYHLTSASDLIRAGFNKRPYHLEPVEILEQYQFHLLSPDDIPLNNWL